MTSVDIWRQEAAERSRRMADGLFKEDGTVRLPRSAPLAVSLAAASGHCLSRQPTLERAEAVMHAAEPIAAARGHTLEIRPGASTWGVYVQPAP